MHFTVLICALAAYGCGSDDPAVVALARKYGSVEFRDGQVVALSLHGKAGVDGREASEILPVLDRLPSLEELRINGVALSKDDIADIKTLKKLRILRLRGCGLTDDDLQFFKDLESLTELAITFSPVTDEGLKYLADLKNLTHLNLSRTQICGPGFAHLKGLSKLEWLELNSTPLDDRAMPLIAANFKYLRRISFGNTHVTPAGLMQLIDLHWLQVVGPPDDIIRPGEDVVAQMQEKAVLYVRFREAHTVSKQKARAAGLEVPPDHVGPFGSALGIIRHQQRLNQQKPEAETPPAHEGPDGK